MGCTFLHQKLHSIYNSFPKWVREQLSLPLPWHPNTQMSKFWLLTISSTQLMVCCTHITWSTYTNGHHSTVLMPETVNPEGQKPDLFNWLALSSVQQGTIREKPETAAPAQICHDSLWGPGQITVFPGLSFPADIKTYLNKRASEVSSSSNTLWEYRPKAQDSCFFMTTWLIITQGWAQ